MDVEWSGNNSNLESLEAEVERQANERSLDVLFLLLDKLDRIELSSVGDRLRYYVALKMTRHHFRKRFWDCNLTMSNDDYYGKLHSLNTKIKEARRNYYVAKRFNE
jgi:hypothetical protein